MLVIHRDGQLRVEISKDVEDEGPDAVEAFVNQYHANHPEEGARAREAYRVSLTAELAEMDEKALQARAARVCPDLDLTTASVEDLRHAILDVSLPPLFGGTADAEPPKRSRRSSP